MNKLFKYAGCFAILILTVLLGGCSATKFVSNWNKEKISVDGNSDEWKNLEYFKDQELLMGISNNGRDIYLCLKTSKRDLIAQTAMSGITFWFDSAGGKEKNNGIRFPAVNRNRGQGRPHAMGMRNMNLDDMYEKIKNELSQAEIIRGEPKENFIIALDRKNGIEAAMTIKENVMTIEMKLPLRRSVDNIFALSTDTGKVVGIGLTTPNLKEMMPGSGIEERQGGDLGTGLSPGGDMGGAMEPGAGRMRPGGGGRGFGGGNQGGMRGGGMGAGAFNPLPPLDLWLAVFIAPFAKSEK